MIIGCGVDIVYVKRFEKYVTNDNFIKRFFHPEEIQSIRINNTIKKESLAARFAAKEALGKALGTGIGVLTLKDICVSKDEKGRPSMTVYNQVKQKLYESGANKIHVSLSHDKDYTIAQVILEKQENSHE